MNMNTVQIQSFTDASITYDITDDGAGHITCTCPDYVNRRKDAGTTCKHIRVHLEKTYSIPDLQMRDGKPFVLNQKGKWVSWAQFMHLRNARAIKSGILEESPAPAVQAPAPAVVQPSARVVNTDALALVDLLGTADKLPAKIDALKSRLTAGKTSSFTVNVEVIHATLVFHKIGRGWNVEIIKNA